MAEFWQKDLTGMLQYVWKHECMTLSVMQSKGQVTIPAQIRNKLGLKKGALVAFVETKNGIILSPQETIAMGTLDKIGEIIKEKGITLEELMNNGREIRGKLIKRDYKLPKS